MLFELLVPDKVNQVSFYSYKLEFWLAMVEKNCTEKCCIWLWWLSCFWLISVSPNYNSRTSKGAWNAALAFRIIWDPQWASQGLSRLWCFSYSSHLQAMGRLLVWSNCDNVKLWHNLLSSFFCPSKRGDSQAWMCTSSVSINCVAQERPLTLT